MSRNAQYHIKAIEELYEEQILAATGLISAIMEPTSQSNITKQERYIENKRRSGSSSICQLSYWLEEMYSYKTPVQMEEPDNGDGREQKEVVKLFLNSFCFLR